MVAPGQRAWRSLGQRARVAGPVWLAAGGRWLILAPHPDDETLGGGALLALLAAGGADPRVAFLTDGAGSHHGAPGWSPDRIGRARAGEAAQALRTLGVGAPALQLGWRDAAPAAAGSAAFARTVRRLAGYCRRHHVRRLAVSWGGEGHCDHVAAAAVARAVAVASHGRVRLYEYLVWGWTDPELAARVRTRSVLAVDVTRHRARQFRALQRHRSQLGGRIRGAAVSFRLPPAMIALTRRPRLILLRGGGCDAA